MPFLDYILGFSSQAPVWPHDANDERAWRSTSGDRGYWGGHSGPSLTGQYVDEDGSIGVSCVFLSVLIYAGLLGTNPIKFYRTLPREEGEEPIYNHPLLSLLSTDGASNPWQTGAMYRMMHVAHQTLWGLHVSRVKWGESGMELWPVDPEHITQVDQLANGKRRFHVSEPGVTSEILLQDECFVLDGFGTHKLIPESLLRRSREAVGVWLAQQNYRSTYFAHGAQGSLIFEHPALMSDPAQKRFKETIQARIGGARNAHKVTLVEEGIKTRELGHTARNAQLVEAWDAQAIEISRFTGVPAYMLGASEAPPYNSRETAWQEFGSLQLKPRRRLIEAAYKRYLIPEPDVVCEIDLSEVFEGDALAVAQTDAIYIMNGVKSQDEIRKRLGMNPLGTDESSTPRRAVNQGPDRGGDPRQPREKNPGDREVSRGRSQALSADDRRGTVDTPIVETARAEGPPSPRGDGSNNNSSGSSEHLTRVLESSARQLLHRETESLRRRAVQLANDSVKWQAFVADFYREHAKVVADRLAIELGRARAYTEEHARRVVSEGVKVCDEWEENGKGVGEMVRLAIGERQ